MNWRALLLLGAVKCIMQGGFILSPEFNDVWENSTLELSCHTSREESLTRWELFKPWHFRLSTSLRFSKEGECIEDGFLTDSEYFETRCYSNGTFKVKIKRVNISNHGQIWFCGNEFGHFESNLAVINVQGMVQEAVMLSPKFNNVWVNSSLELSCYTSREASSTMWTILNETQTFYHYSISSWTPSYGGACIEKDFLTVSEYFETRCYSNGTLNFKIKRVNISNHGQIWFCGDEFGQSNFAFINVQVPIKYVNFTNIDGDALQTVENVKTKLTCETSEGRPAANITWAKILKNGTQIDISNEIAYGDLRKETVTERGMTIVSSSIDIKVLRGDNESRIICEATNDKSYVARAEITLLVQSKEPATARYTLLVSVAVGTFVAILVAVSITISYRYTRRKGNDSQQTDEVTAAQTASINDENNEHFEEIHVYEPLDEQLTEQKNYMELKSFTEDDSAHEYVNTTI